MNDNEAIILRAAYELGNGQPRLIEYKLLAVKTNFDEASVRAIAGLLQQQRLCMATFGGLQLTATALRSLAQN